MCDLRTGDFQLCSHPLSWKPRELWGTPNMRREGRTWTSLEQPHNVSQQQLFSGPIWSDDGGPGISGRHDCEGNKSTVRLWLDSDQEPGWVDSQLAIGDPELKVLSEPSLISAQVPQVLLSHERDKEVLRRCIKLCTEGPINDAVDALSLLVHRRLYVRNNLFYRFLKRCIADKNLVLGKRIHALIIQSGHEGDDFLATHLINLYASHGLLEEAVPVFTTVSAPSAYTWGAIILAYARQGNASEAVRLYREMRRSAVIPDNHIYLAVLKACARVGDLAAGKEVHAHILQSLEKPDIYVQNCLIDMYAKCGSLEDARRVFESLTERNVVVWTAMIAAYAQQEMGWEALSLYSRMQQDGLSRPDSVTFVCLLQACASLGALALSEGKQIHAQIEEQGRQDDVVLGGSLVNMYAKCGSLEDARKVFNKLSERNVVAWTAMITGYVQQGIGQEALSLYGSMQQEGLSHPDLVTFVCLLQACASVGVGALHQGKLLHKQIEEQGLQNDVVVGGSLVNMYAKCGSIQDARRVFNKLSERNVVAWTAMVAGYTQQGMAQEALSLYISMRREQFSPNSVTLVCLLQACGSVGVSALPLGKQLHTLIVIQGLQDDESLGGSLVSMYSKCGSLEDARKVFEGLPKRNAVVCTAMIAAYAQHGMVWEALSVYSTMQQEGLFLPDNVTFVCLLQACARVGVEALQQGKQLHTQIEEQGLQEDVVLGGSLVNMYVKCGSLEEAQRVFDRLPEQNLVTWNAMLAGYAQRGMGKAALCLYSKMQQEGQCCPDSVTFVCLLQACDSIGEGGLQEGRQLHAQIEERGVQIDVVLGGSLVNMYAKFGAVEDARNVFDRLSDRNVVTWNALLAGYAQQGMGQEALSLYNGMREEGLCPPNSITFACILQACAMIAALPSGKVLHAHVIEQGLQADVVVGAALVNMYAKCGSMSDAQLVFNSLTERTNEAWGALISGYARLGECEAVFHSFDKMILDGVLPTCSTFISLLTVCSHAGLVDKGRGYFEVMRTSYGINPAVEHYTCMMDLLGRAGYLDEALHMAKTMPVPADGAVWLTLLGACRKWNNIDVGGQAFEFAMKLDGKESAPYVLMSNMYAKAGMWEEAKELQARRVKCGAWKTPGQSWWTDMEGVVHTFVVGHKEGSETEVICSRLEELLPDVKIGHV